MKVLVAYGTKRGSTGEVAGEIAKTLASRGFDVELRPASEVKDLGSYAAAVLGGSIYMGRLHPDVLRLLKKRRAQLRELPVAVFAMGPKTLAEEDVASAHRQLEGNLAKVPELRPASVAIFGGVIDPAKLHFPFDRMPASDARDWDAIRAWAEALPDALRLEPIPEPAARRDF